jgi:hypothetical protein
LIKFDYEKKVQKEESKRIKRIATLYITITNNKEVIKINNA